MCKKIFKIFFGALFSLLILLVFTITYLQRIEEKQEFNAEEARKISYTPLVRVVPGNSLPKNVKPSKSNNNLDIVKFSSRYYFAFRSAPVHFASEEAVLYVVSSADLKMWEYETQFRFGSDVREPRFMTFKGKLFLYFFKGGSNLFSFAPEHIYATEFISRAKWTKPKPVYEPGYVIWRAKEHNGKAYMSVYYGVGLYSNETEPGHLQLLESADGYNYKLVNNKEVSNEASAEEGEFEFDKNGNLYATIRLEMKGGKVCRAKKEALSDWECKFTPYKYDSALMFRHNDELYVIARRNVAGTYNCDSKFLPKFLRSKWSLARYSLTRKRTAMYRLNKEKLELEPLFDFPSRGDTAYAGIVKAAGKQYYVLNYSTGINGPDTNWLWGQFFGSNIYETYLRFK